MRTMTDTSNNASEADLSTFDPTFLKDQEFTGDLNTRLTPIPEGEYYAQCTKIDLRKAKGKDGRPLCLCDVTFTVQDEGVKAATQLTEPQVRMSIFIEIGPGGKLLTADDNPNANVRLGRLKEALGMRAGRPWSFPKMEGNSCYVRVKQRTDENDPAIIYSDCVAVSKEAFGGGKKAAA